MNRRVFISSAASATAIATTLRLGTKTAFAQSGSNPTVYNSSATAAAIAGGTSYSAPSSAVWTAFANSLAPVYTDWMTNKNDVAMQPFYESATPA
jgi:hypothetical protein